LEVDVQQGNFKVLQLLPQVLILFLVEKWIPPSRSETTEIGQKTKGILGVKCMPKFYVPTSDSMYLQFILKKSCYPSHTRLTNPSFSLASMMIKPPLVASSWVL
jgi:hypothetical protein